MKLLVFRRFPWYNWDMETVTITKAEYDSLVGERARLERQVEYLLEQMRLSRHRQFGGYIGQDICILSDRDVIALVLRIIIQHYGELLTSNTGLRDKAVVSNAAGDAVFRRSRN